MRDGRWRATLDLGRGDDGRRARKHLYGSTQAEALSKLRDAQHLAKNAIVTDDKITVGQFLDRWLSETLPGTIAESTLDDYGDTCRLHLVPALGKKQLSKLTVAEVNKLWSQKRAAGYAPNSVRIMRAVLRRALHQAEIEEIIIRNVAAKSTPPRLGRSEGRSLTIEQAKTFLDAARGDRLEACYLIMVTHGLRRGEALGLSWADLDTTDGTIKIRHAVIRRHGFLDTNGVRVRTPLVEITEVKTDRSRRTVYLTPEEVDALRSHKAIQAAERLAAGALWQDRGLIFPTEIGTPLDPDVFGKRFVKLIAGAGLGHWHPHELRHSAASLMLAEGVPLEMVSKVLGHSGIAITANVYGYLAEGAERDAAQRMAAALSR
jgi:integrase